MLKSGALKSSWYFHGNHHISHRNVPKCPSKPDSLIGSSTYPSSQDNITLTLLDIHYMFYPAIQISFSMSTSWIREVNKGLSENGLPPTQFQHVPTNRRAGMLRHRTFHTLPLSFTQTLDVSGTCFFFSARYGETSRCLAIDGPTPFTASQSMLVSVV